MASEQLTCISLLPQVSGLPTPDLTWLLDGKPVRQDSTHRMLVRENGVHSLVIEPVSARDAGIYTCVATNRAGQNSFVLELVVAGRPGMHAQGERALSSDPSVSRTCSRQNSGPCQSSWSEPGMRPAKARRDCVSFPRQQVGQSRGSEQLCWVFLVLGPKGFSGQRAPPSVHEPAVCSACTPLVKLPIVISSFNI